IQNLKTLELTKFYIDDNTNYYNNLYSYIINYNNINNYDIKILNDQFLREFTQKFEFNHGVINNYTITKPCVDYYYYGKKSSSKDHKIHIEWV
ncbi:hypothetical protein RhiirA5_444454, partial [Rhizophagus irregularis]